MPIVHFGFWDETLEKWASEGHLTLDEAHAWHDGNYIDRAISAKLGFDFNWSTNFGCEVDLFPPFEPRLIKELPDGGRHVLNKDGAIVLEKPGIVSIPAEVDHLLRDRQSWEESYLHRLQFTEERLNGALVHIGDEPLRFDQGGRAVLESDERDFPLGLWCGSLFGVIRNWMGLVGLSYLTVDDEVLLDEMIETVGNLCYEGAQAALATGIHFDFGHFWEDICFKSGPLVNPRLFATKVGPHYRRIAELLNKHNIDIVSLDCDGKIDALVPIWLENGINTMFPIEVGTWNASIQPWREQYGRELRGVGGMNKTVFSLDYEAVDAEVERLKPLVELGGYIPCPDHRVAPDAKWENIQYYCDRMRQVFG
jgi:uroporphyrinogen decarboxylase